MCRPPKPVMRHGQVEDQAPAASGIAQILSDLHVLQSRAVPITMLFARGVLLQCVQVNTSRIHFKTRETHSSAAHRQRWRRCHGGRRHRVPGCPGHSAGRRPSMCCPPVCGLFCRDAARLCTAGPAGHDLCAAPTCSGVCALTPRMHTRFIRATAAVRAFARAHRIVLVPQRVLGYVQYVRHGAPVCTRSRQVCTLPSAPAIHRPLPSCRAGRGQPGRHERAEGGGLEDRGGGCSGHGGGEAQHGAGRGAQGRHGGAADKAL